jgi:hypothetical protein
VNQQFSIGGIHLKAHFALKNESWQEKLLNKEDQI